MVSCAIQLLCTWIINRRSLWWLCLNSCSASTRSHSSSAIAGAHGWGTQMSVLGDTITRKLAPQTNSSVQSSKANQPLHTCSKVLKEEVLVAMLPVPCSEPLWWLASAGGIVVAIGCPRLAKSSWAPTTAPSQRGKVSQSEWEARRGLILQLLFSKWAGRRISSLVQGKCPVSRILQMLRCSPPVSHSQEMLTWAWECLITNPMGFDAEMGNLSTLSRGGKLSTEMHLCDANFPFV